MAQTEAIENLKQALQNKLGALSEIKKKLGVTLLHFPQNVALQQEINDLKSEIEAVQTKLDSLVGEIPMLSEDEVNALHDAISRAEAEIAQTTSIQNLLAAAGALRNVLK